MAKKKKYISPRCVNLSSQPYAQARIDCDYGSTPSGDDPVCWNGGNPAGDGNECSVGNTPHNTEGLCYATGSAPYGEYGGICDGGGDPA